MDVEITQILLFYTDLVVRHQPKGVHYNKCQIMPVGRLQAFERHAGLYGKQYVLIDVRKAQKSRGETQRYRGVTHGYIKLACVCLHLWSPCMLLPQSPERRSIDSTGDGRLTVFVTNPGVDLGSMHSNLHWSLDPEFYLMAFDGNDGNANVIAYRNRFSQLPCQDEHVCLLQR
jgi:hypothetical protein